MARTMFRLPLRLFIGGGAAAGVRTAEAGNSYAAVPNATTRSRPA
jgi:hypothetical protein